MIKYQGIKLSIRFRIKNQTKLKHRNDLLYYRNCTENDCKETYIGKTDRKTS